MNFVPTFDTIKTVRQFFDYVPVAQMDRVAASGAVGLGFESQQARSSRKAQIKLSGLFLLARREKAFLLYCLSETDDIPALRVLFMFEFFHGLAGSLEAFFIIYIFAVIGYLNL